MIVEDFEKEVVKNPKAVVVDFYADWCGPCKMFAPIFEKTAQKFSDDVEFKKVDVEKMADDASKFGVMSIPTIVMFKNGEEISRHSGFMNEAEFMKFVESNS